MGLLCLVSVSVSFLLCRRLGLRLRAGTPTEFEELSSSPQSGFSSSPEGATTGPDSSATYESRSPTTPSYQNPLSTSPCSTCGGSRHPGDTPSPVSTHPLLQDPNMSRRTPTPALAPIPQSPAAEHGPKPRQSRNGHGKYSDSWSRAGRPSTPDHLVDHALDVDGWHDDRTEEKTEAIDFADESITHGSLHAHQGAWLYRPTAHQGACIDVGDWQTEADEGVTIGGSSKIERTVAPASPNGTTEEKNAMSSKSSPKKDKR